MNMILQEIYEPSKYAMGFAKNRSVVDNAKRHINQNYVFNIDLKDFFPSITRARISARLKVKPFEFSDDIARMISGLCTMKVSDGENVKYVLPQGAPTSPTITNIICDKLDHKLAGLAKRFGLNYSRYADDITFSSSHNVYQEESDFRKELQRIITEDGFVINDKKTRLQKRGSRQEVTGVIVCEKANVTKKYVKEIRNLLYIWERYGYDEAVKRFHPRYKAEKGHVKKHNPNLYAVLEGKLLYLKMVKGENDYVYKRLQGKYDHLMEVKNPIIKPTDNQTNNEALISELENLLDELLK
jgi:retron-type reverse transcriptase